ncbi:hypothetical protein LINGRAHAP2_LOCUS24876 [Linum grandiflorum]
MAASASNSQSNQQNDCILTLNHTKTSGATGPYNLLMDKFICQRKANMRMVKGRIRRAWPDFHQTIKVKDAKENKFLFIFKTRQAMKAVWDRRPWLIFETTMVVKKWDGRGQPEDVQFLTGDFWVRVHNISPTHMNWDNMRVLNSLFPRTLHISQVGLDGDTWTRYKKMVEIDLQARVRSIYEFEMKGIMERVTFEYEKGKALMNDGGTVGGDEDCVSSPPRFSRRHFRGTFKRETLSPCHSSALMTVVNQSLMLTPLPQAMRIKERQTLTPATEDLFSRDCLARWEVNLSNLEIWKAP